MDHFEIGEASTITPRCSNRSCKDKDGGGAGCGAEATKVCLDHSVPLNQRADIPPPAFFCTDCAEEIRAAAPEAQRAKIFEDMTLPIVNIEMVCENKNCRGQVAT